ncbi:MAG: fibronectin type III domain-containing protein [Rhodospirillaceae bacterium]
MRILLACLLAFLATPSPSAASDTKPPTVPRGLTVTGVTGGSVSLAWQASSDFKGGSGVAAYDVLRNGTIVGSAVDGALTYTDFGLASATTYQYAVRARDNAGNVSVPSVPVSATTMAEGGCSALPGVPALVSATTVSSSAISLEWTTVAPPDGCVVTYNVYRYEDNSPVTIATGLVTTTYTAAGLEPSTTYSFSVSATDSFGSSNTSARASATTSKEDVSTPKFPARVFAPYVDVLLWPTPSLTAMATQSGARYFSAGFIVAGSGCQATWGRHYAMADGFLIDDIASLRGLGGDVIAAFGGAAGTELALACSTADALQAQYQSVIDTYGVSRLDFDIEGSALGNAAANDRRAKAIAGLQRVASAEGRTLTVQFTLPVMPSGLTSDGVALLRNAILDNQVDVGVVNIMAMDYGRSYPDNMGQHAVDAMTSTIRQLAGLYGVPESDAGVRAMVGVTPMIGLNDVSPEVFTFDDAARLVREADSAGIGFLAFWSATRDQPCPKRQVVSPTCSGVVQSPWEFTRIFNPFTGGY